MNYTNYNPNPRIVSRLNKLNDHSIGTRNEYKTYMSHIEEFISAIVDVKIIGEMSTADAKVALDDTNLSKFALNRCVAIYQKDSTNLLARIVYDNLYALDKIEYSPFSDAANVGSFADINVSNIVILMMIVDAVTYIYAFGQTIDRQFIHTQLGSRWTNGERKCLMNILEQFINDELTIKMV